ncbi:bromodomain-containing protein C631.02 isoform X1 [Prunus yedoensis var. nudiflora]|uniref:Bromodomain-containing protein C631.02 isoform X1 n=1 Tax=Prunus yedoensis var. nudiflora TaxID=2094558 RepID=A0A314Z5Y4_PRUYE|nr:bromodomain-containing protein C631.02 isoform X1 [Prunus yedoensis var. nudiflora]
MKRKRKNKKGKPKGSVAGGNEALSSGVIVNLEDDANLDEDGNYENRSESAMEVDTPSSTGTDQHCNLANINPDGSIDRGAGKSMGRVKVKLRTSRTMESQPTSSDAYTQSDTDKSSQQIGLEKQGVVSEKMEDSANSLAEVKIGASGNVSKKVGSIKIKSSKALGSSVNHSIDPIPARSESPYDREPKMSDQDSRYNREELDTALMIIKKVMKMDAAEPFNVPVNPEALGIPMITGLLKVHAATGVLHYEELFFFKRVLGIDCLCLLHVPLVTHALNKDVSLNSASSYLFYVCCMLYFVSLSIYICVESTQDTLEPSDQGKVHLKGSQLKQKTRKGHGRRHKSDCLCAICVLKRRRREREENARIAKSQHGASE